MTEGIDRLDNEYQAFLRAQDVLGDLEAVKMEVTSRVPLRRYIDPQVLQSALDEVDDAKLDTAQRQYLMLTDRFQEEFLDYLEIGLPPAKVLANDNDIKVVVEGTWSDVTQWEALIGIAVHRLYYDGLVAADNLNVNVLASEGVRRFHVKGDMLRASGVHFVEAGTRYRCDAGWYDFLVDLLIGDLGDSLEGTTNMAMAMRKGLEPIATPASSSLDSPSVSELEAAVQQGDERPVVTGANAFQIAHLASHVGPDNVLFEWGEDLVSDLGPARSNLGLSWSF